MRGFLLPAEALLSPCQPHPWAEAPRSDTGAGHHQRSADALRRGGTELTPLAVLGEMCTLPGGSRYQGRYRGWGATLGWWLLAVLPSCIRARGSSHCQQNGEWILQNIWVSNGSRCCGIPLLPGCWSGTPVPSGIVPF